MGMGYGQPTYYNPQGQAMNPYYAQWMPMRRMPVMPAPEPSKIAEMMAKRKANPYQLNAPTAAQMFPGLMAALDSANVQAPMEGSSGAGRFVGLLGNKA